MLLKSLKSPILFIFSSLLGSWSAAAQFEYWNLQRRDSKQVTIEVSPEAVVTATGQPINVDDEIALSGTPGSKWRVAGDLGLESSGKRLLLSTPSECPHELGALVSRGANGTWEPWAGVYEYKRGFIPKGNQVHEAHTNLLESQDYCTGSAVCRGFCFQLMDNQSRLVPLKAKPSTWILDAHDKEYRYVKMRTDFKSVDNTIGQTGVDDGFWWSAIKLDDPRAFCVKAVQHPGRKCPQSPFACLGVSVDASEAAVKQAFRKMALQHHPDKLGNKVDAETKRRSEEMFRQISDSHDVLLDKRKRMQAERNQRSYEQMDRNKAKQDADFYSDHRDITTMEPTSYRQFLQIARGWVIHFYQPGMTESLQLKTAFSVAASTVVNEATDILYGAVNCKRYETFCRGKGVKPGTQRIVFLQAAQGRREQFNGRDSSTLLIGWIREVRRSESEVAEITSWPPPGNHKAWVLLFYKAKPKMSSSCPLCGDGALPLLRRAAGALIEAGLQVGHVNCTASKFCDDLDLSSRDSPQQPTALEFVTIKENSLVVTTSLINSDFIPRPWTQEHIVIALSAASTGAAASYTMLSSTVRQEL